MTRRTEPTPAPETTAAALPGHPLDEHALEAKRSARRAALAALPDVGGDMARASLLAQLRLEIAWARELNPNVSAHLLVGRIVEYLRPAGVGTALLAYDACRVLEITEEEFVAEALRNLGRDLDLRLRKMNAREKEEAKRHGREIARGRQIAELLVIMGNEMMSDDRRREAARDLTAIAPDQARAAIAAMEEAIAAREAIFDARHGATDERNRREWAASTAAGRAEHAAYAALGQRSLEREGA